MHRVITKDGLGFYFVEKLDFDARVCLQKKQLEKQLSKTRFCQVLFC